MNIKHVTVTTLFISLTAALASGCGVGEARVASDDAVESATPIPVETAMPSLVDIVATYEATTTIASPATLAVTHTYGTADYRAIVGAINGAAVAPSTKKKPRPKRNTPKSCSSTTTKPPSRCFKI